MTWPNALTFSRLLVCTGILILAGILNLYYLVVAGLVVNWLTDILDGYIARRRLEETVTGAQYDYYADRFVLSAALAVHLKITGVAILPTGAAGAVWAQYVVVDQFLCSQFLRFDRWTPDELWQVDDLAWRLNWSPVAKFVGNLPLVLVVIGTPATCVVGFAAASLIICVRLPTYQRLSAQILNRQRPREESESDSADLIAA